jgi:hypothetical protein
MGNFSPLSDTLRGFPVHSNIQTVIHNLIHHPAFLPGAIIASQTLFFGVQAIAVWVLSYICGSFADFRLCL